MLSAYHISRLQTFIFSVSRGFTFSPMATFIYKSTQLRNITMWQAVYGRAILTLYLQRCFNLPECQRLCQKKSGVAHLVLLSNYIVGTKYTMSPFTENMYILHIFTQKFKAAGHSLNLWKHWGICCREKNRQLCLLIIS